MSAKMIVEFRRKPSRARQMAAKRERNAYLDRILREELRRVALVMSTTYATPRDY